MTTTPPRCWRPDCRRDAPWQFTGGDWALWSCDRPWHLAVATSVTGRQPVRIRTWRDGREALFDVESGGGR